MVVVGGDCARSVMQNGKDCVCGNGNGRVGFNAGVRLTPLGLHRGKVTKHGDDYGIGRTKQLGPLS